MEFHKVEHQTTAQSEVFCDEMYAFYLLCIVLRRSKNQTSKPAIYSGRNTIKCLTETAAASTARLICLRNLGLKVTPGFSLTVHVTTRRTRAVMAQLVGDGRCCAAHRLHAALRERAPRPRRSAGLRGSAAQRQLMGGDGGETRERKKKTATCNKKRSRRI